MLKLIQLTDTHIVTDPKGTLYGVSTEDSLEQVLDHIQQTGIDADALLVTGDLVHDDGELAYRKLEQMLSRLNLPTHYIAGNHDDAVVLHQCLPNSPASGIYLVEMHDWLVIMLDSAVPGKVEGYLPATTLAALDSVLGLNQDRHVLIAVHHHPVNTGSDWMDRIGIANADEFVALLKQHANVRLVINGHIHQLLHVEVGHFTVLGTPSTCAQFKPGMNQAGIDDAPPGYRYLELHEDGAFTTEVFRI